MRILILGISLLLMPALMLGQGVLVAVGGGSEENHSGSWSEEPYRTIADYTHNDTLVVLSESSTSDWIPNYFNSLGVDVVHNMQINNHTVSQIVEKLRTASGVFMKGGDQRDYIDAWKGTDVVGQINRIYAEGGVVSGTSAGAMSLSEFVSTGGPYSYENLENPTNRYNDIESSFLSLRAGLVFDTHYFQRGRIGRLLGIFAKQWFQGERDLTAIGIDDQTAVIIMADGKATVSGSGGVHFFRPDSSFSMLSGSDEPLHLRRLHTRQITHGFSIDLNTFEIVSTPDDTETVPQRSPGFIRVVSVAEELFSESTLNGFHNSDGEDSKWVVIDNGETDVTSVHANTFIADLSENIDEGELASQLQSADRIFFDLSAMEIRAEIDNQTTIGSFVRDVSQNESAILLFDSSLKDRLGKSFITNMTSDKGASYYGDFTTGEGAGVLEDGLVYTSSFVEDDYDENRATAMPWLMHEHGLSWGIWATGAKSYQIAGDSILVESDWYRSGSRSTPTIVMDATDGYLTAQSPFSFNSSGNHRHSVSISNGYVSVIPSGVWGYPFAGDLPTAIEDDFEDEMENDDQKPSSIRIEQIYPNPFNPATTMILRASTFAEPTLTVHNLLGQQILKKNLRIGPGKHQLNIDLSNHSSGTYIVTIRTAEEVISRQITLIK